MRYYELLEVSQRIKDQMVDRWTQMDAQLDRSTAIDYITRFERLVNNLPKESRDITVMSFDQLKRVVDDAEFKGELRGRKEVNQQVKTTDGLIYDKNNLVIYLGDSKEKCIVYGKGYSWCISRSDASNLFYSYRMIGGERVFYFVFDRDLPRDNIYHAMVIHVHNNNEYTITNSANNGDRGITWDELVKIQPKLVGLQSLFKYKPLNSEEKSDYALYGKELSLEGYKDLPLRGKYKYIMFGHELSEEQQLATPDELIGVYAKTMPSGISKSTYARLKSGDRKKTLINASSDGAVACNVAENVLYAPWFLSEDPVARHISWTTDLEAKIGGDNVYAYEAMVKDMMPDDELMGEFLSNAARRSIAIIAVRYNFRPIREYLSSLSESDLLSLLKEMYDVDQEYFRGNELYFWSRAKTFSKEVILKFIRWAVISRKDYRLLRKEYGMTPDRIAMIDNDISVSIWRRALKLGLSKHEVPNRVLSSNRIADVTSYKKAQEEYRVNIATLKRIVERHIDVMDIDDVDAFNFPEFITTIIKDHIRELKGE